MTLRPARRELIGLQPAYIRRMPRPVDAALLAAMCVAVGSPDVELAMGFTMGFDAVGSIPASGCGGRASTRNRSCLSGSARWITLGGTAAWRLRCRLSG